MKQSKESPPRKDPLLPHYRNIGPAAIRAALIFRPQRPAPAAMAPEAAER